MKQGTKMRLYTSEEPNRYRPQRGTARLTVPIDPLYKASKKKSGSSKEKKREKWSWEEKVSRSLIPVRRLISRAGKTFMQTVWVGRNKEDQKMSHTNTPQKKEETPSKTDTGKPFSTVNLMKSKSIMDYAPNSDSSVQKLMAFQEETFEGSKERPSVYEVMQVADAEVTEALSHENSGADWYQEEVSKLRATLSTKYPEFGSDTKWNMFLTILSASSPNQAVQHNLEVGLRIYDHYKKTGDIPRNQYEESGKVHESGDNKGEPMAWGVANSGIYKLKTLVDRFQDKYGDKGEEEFIQFMNGATVRSELEEEFEDMPKGQKVNISGKKDEAVLNAMVFGEKVGMFYGGLAGIPGAVASDRWAIRSFRRWTGELTDEVIEKEQSDGTVQRENVIDRFASTEDRRQFEYICQTLGEKHGISAAAVQAVFWYYEKRLYQKIGIAPTSDVSYSDVAEEVMNDLNKAEGFDMLGREDVKNELMSLVQSGNMPTLHEFMQWLKELGDIA